MIKPYKIYVHPEEAGKMGTPNCETCRQARWIEEHRPELTHLTSRTWPEKKPCLCLKSKVGHLEISTVFLHVDHSYDASESQWYETMVFDQRKRPGESEGQYFDRYPTKKEAIKGHADVVARVRQDQREQR